MFVFFVSITILLKSCVLPREYQSKWDDVFNQWKKVGEGIKEMHREADKMDSIIKQQRDRLKASMEKKQPK